jgi:hypothetical protein
VTFTAAQPPTCLCCITYLITSYTLYLCVFLCARLCFLPYILSTS